MNWKQSKILFNFITNQKYLIKKDIQKNNILFIKWNQSSMKCKYFYAFTIDDKYNIYWSCDNLFVDQKTKYLSFIIKKMLNEKKTFNTNLLNKIKNIIQSDFFTTFQDEKIYFLWCLISNYKNQQHFYIITEIIFI